MAYVKTDWENLPSTDTPITDTALDNMENGIEYNDQRLNGTKPMGSIVVDDVKCKNMLNKNVFSNSYLNNGVETSSPQSALFNYIQVKPNTQYTFSSSSSIRYLAIYEFNDTKTYLTIQLSENTSNYSFTTGNNTKYIRIDINKDASAIMTQSVIDTLIPQLELGSTATTYTPYINIIKEQNGYVKENTTFYANDFKCRNLLPNTIGTQTTNGVTITKNNDGSITLNGTATAGITLNGYFALTLKAGAYTHSISNTAPVGLYLSLNNINATMIGQTGAEQKVTFTITEDTTYQRYVIFITSGMTFNNFRIYPQIEAGSEVTPYTPHKEFENGVDDTGWVNLNSSRGVWYRMKNSVVTIRIGDYTATTINAYGNLSLGTLPDYLKPPVSITGSVNFKNSSNAYLDPLALFRVMDTGEVRLQNWTASNFSYNASEGSIIYII